MYINIYICTCVCVCIRIYPCINIYLSIYLSIGLTRAMLMEGAIKGGLTSARKLWSERISCEGHLPLPIIAFRGANNGLVGVVRGPY